MQALVQIITMRLGLYMEAVVDGMKAPGCDFATSSWQDQLNQVRRPPPPPSEHLPASLPVRQMLVLRQ